MNSKASMARPIPRPADSECEELFARFNSAFFDGRIPAYHIRVQADPVLSPGGRGYHDRKGRTITLLLLPRPELDGTLVHEMAHASTNDYHGPRWVNEMRRLFRRGAPLSELDLRRLCLRPNDGVQCPPLADSWGW